MDWEKKIENTLKKSSSLHDRQLRIMKTKENVANNLLQFKIYLLDVVGV